jgi:hypothetical protein
MDAIELSLVDLISLPVFYAANLTHSTTFFASAPTHCK